MPTDLTIDVKWERLSEGDPEERATFGMLRVRSNQITLTEGHDTFVNDLREGPLVSAYHAAEWFAWNWWRLRWEPQTDNESWSFAHSMTTIGHGYVWPNITIRSDGARIALVSRPSTRSDAKPFRYLGSSPVVVSAAAFEACVDDFVGGVISRLEREQIQGTNLGRVWQDVLRERADPQLALRRRLEALLGAEPDEANEAMVDSLLKDVQEAGTEAIAELAANTGAKGRHHTLVELRREAETVGADANLDDAATLPARELIKMIGLRPAWMIGVDAARALRNHEQLGDGPISTARLEDLAGVARNTIRNQRRGGDLSFLIETDRDARIVLRSSWETSRRFDVARLIGDRILLNANEALKPATRSYTYRQRLQRAFAGEFLCPFRAAEDYLRGDYSTEAIDEAAGYFDVSSWTVRTLLMNHGRIARDELEIEPDSLEAA
jgi:hypothetical protein